MHDLVRWEKALAHQRIGAVCTDDARGVDITDPSAAAQRQAEHTVLALHVCAAAAENLDRIRTSETSQRSNA